MFIPALVKHTRVWSNWVNGVLLVIVLPLYFGSFNLLTRRRANAVTLISLVMDEYFSHSIPNGAHMLDLYVGSSRSVSEVLKTSVHLTGFDLFTSDSHSEFVCSSSSLSEVGHSFSGFFNQIGPCYHN